MEAYCLRSSGLPAPYFFIFTIIVNNQERVNMNELTWENLSIIQSQPGFRRERMVGVTFIKGYPNNLRRIQTRLQEQATGIPVTLKRNPNNQYDSNACEVWDDIEGMLGHLSKETAAELAPLLDGGTSFSIVLDFVGAVPDDPSKLGAMLRIVKE